MVIDSVSGFESAIYSHARQVVIGHPQPELQLVRLWAHFPTFGSGTGIAIVQPYSLHLATECEEVENNI